MTTDQQRLYSTIKANPVNDFEKLKTWARLTDIELVKTLQSLLDAALIFHNRGDKKGNGKGWRVSE